MHQNQISEVWNHAYAPDLYQALLAIDTSDDNSKLDLSYVERASFSCVQVLAAFVSAQAESAELIVSSSLNEAIVDLGLDAFFKQKGTIECR